VAAKLFDEALSAAGLDSKVVAHLVGVSISLVDKWRSPNEERSPSLAQLLSLPFAFHLELHRAMNRHFGFGRAALRRLIDAVGELAGGLE
jgi:hypothetical protein